MCVEPHHRPGQPIGAAICPEPAVAPIDPVPLSPVDAVTLTTLVDNSIDVLLPDQGPLRHDRTLGRAAFNIVLARCVDQPREEE